MLKGCFWKGKEISCSKIFDTFPTDQGMCCTFNIEKAEKMFKKGKYTKMVKIMQNRDRSLSYDRDFELPMAWQENIEPISEAGISKGGHSIFTLTKSGGGLPNFYICLCKLFG